jgi:HAMP domain-containing protein
MRAKIILPNLLVVLIAGFGAFLWLGSDLHGKATERLRERLGIQSELLRRSEALRGHELLAAVTKQAMSKDVTQAFAPVDYKPAEGETQAQIDAKIRQQWFSRCVRAVEIFSELWGVKNGKKPDLVFLTDRNGVVLARNTTPTACPTGKNVSENMFVVGNALQGSPSYSLWAPEEKAFGKTAVADATKCPLMNTGLLEMAAAPVFVDDEIAGVFVAGFEVSNGVAHEKKRLLGFDVAVETRGDTYSSSLSDEAARQALEAQLKGVSDKLKASIATGKPSDIVSLDIEGEDYLAVISPAANADVKDEIAYVIMGSVGDNDFFAGSLVVLMIITIVAALAVLVIGFVLAAHFMRPIMAIEEGLLKIINGEYEHRFDVKSAEVGGLGFRINQLIGVLTGEDEQADDEEQR